MYTPIMWRAILPEILITLLAVILLVIEPLVKEERRRVLGWLTASGLLISIGLSLAFALPGTPVSLFGGTLRFDWLGFFFKMLFMFSSAATALLLMDHERVGHRGEAYVLLLSSTLGMNLMAASSDLILLYLSVETASIPLYILAGFMLADNRSTEAGFKYLLFGAMTSAAMLYGFTLLFGMVGSTDLYALAAQLASAGGSSPVILGIIFLVLVGVGFKISIVPFHFWAPDVYEGSPTPIAGFLSTASKAAGFAVLLRLFFIVFPTLSLSWTMIFAVLSAVTMTIGNLLTLPQTNIKRLLAYSSVAHAGYAMIGAVSLSPLGAASIVFYLFAYVLTNLLAFGIVMAYGRVTGLEDIREYAGLSRRNPAIALMMLAAFLSLSGMPPFGGFVAKIFVFAAGIEGGYVWLVVVGIINSIIGLYYYLNVMKYVYLYRLPGENEDDNPVPVSFPYGIALTVLVIGVIALGTVFQPWFDWSHAAALNLF